MKEVPPECIPCLTGSQQGIHFRFMPDTKQVAHALEVRGLQAHRVHCSRKKRLRAVYFGFPLYVLVVLKKPCGPVISSLVGWDIGDGEMGWRNAAICGLYDAAT